jgi:hypothetical protein
MDRRFKLAVLFVAVLIAMVVGFIAYHAGVAHGLAIGPQATGNAAAVFRPYRWFRPWGFGLLGPFVFVLFWFFLFRVLLWGGPYQRGLWHPGYYDAPSRFDEWHKRAHERMETPPPAQRSS